MSREYSYANKQYKFIEAIRKIFPKVTVEKALKAFKILIEEPEVKQDEKPNTP